MIATIFDIWLNAANPSLPLRPMCAHVGSPSQLRIHNVPRDIGAWQLRKLYFRVKYPDNSIVSVECTRHGGGRVWSATVAGCSVSGHSGRGYEITADGVDERGNPVTGYVLGVGDVDILGRDGTVTVGTKSWYYHFLDDVPDLPQKCDTCVIDNVLKWYDGTAWQPFASGGAAIDVVPPSTDPDDEGKAATRSRRGRRRRKLMRAGGASGRSCATALT